MNDEKIESPEIEQGRYQRETTPAWFVVLAVLVAAFSAYYIYRYWGGLGPGIPQ